MELTRQSICALLMRDDEIGHRAVGRALVVLHDRQTASEQDMQATTNANSIGYTPSDAKMGSSMAVFYKRNGYLSPKQLAYWRKPNAKGVARVCKYWRQLIEAAEQKAAEKAEQAKESVDKEHSALLADYYDVLDSDCDEIIKPAYDALIAFEAAHNLTTTLMSHDVQVNKCQNSEMRA